VPRISRTTKFVILTRFAAESVLIALVFATHFVIDARVLVYWGCGWAPRFLVPLIPLLGLGLFPLAEDRGWRHWALVAGLAIGIGVQVVTIPTSFWGQVMPIWGELAVPVDASSAGSENPSVETLVHSWSAAPLRVSLWLLENTRCRWAGEKTPLLTPPPWRAEFPWRDANAPAKLAGFVGLDLWAAPACLKPQAFIDVVPANPRLLWMLLVSAALGAALLGSALVRRRSPPDQ